VDGGGGPAAADPEVMVEGSGSGAAPHEMVQGSGSSAAPHETVEGSVSGAAPHEVKETSPPTSKQGAGSKRSCPDKSGQGSEDPSLKRFRRPKASA